MKKVLQSTIDDMRQEAEANLADPSSDNTFIANYDYPARVNSRDLFEVLNELEFLRKKVYG